MILGALAALILDYAAVAAMIALLALDRWLNIRLGTLDLLLILVIAVVVTDSLVAWFAGSRRDRRLAHDRWRDTEASQHYSQGSRRMCRKLRESSSDSQRMPQ
jgi:hypothetical protein